ncbi:ATP-binding domain-containing protein (plasmid) [Bacillus sp. PK9-021]
MEIMIPTASFNEDSLANELVNELEKNQSELELQNASLYHQFPLFKELDQEIEYPSFLLISPNHGLIIIQTDDRSERTLGKEDLEKLYDFTEQIYSYLFAKLIKIPNLRKRRNQLIFEISTILYLPNYQNEIDEEDEIICVRNINALQRTLQQVKIDPLEEEIIKETFSVIEGTKGIPKPVERDIEEGEEDTKGGILEELEKEIATFDKKQKYAALSQIDGPQRIRGMAGSGKTIILAMKAALIHLRNPNANILYTFYTKSLYDHIKQLITRFYRMHEEQDPNWDKIHIRHAWGGQNLPGVYYEACIENGISPMKFSDARIGASLKNMNVFEFVCHDLLARTKGQINKKYDYVLMDEGQDFSKPYYWLCRKLVKNDCLVWAYDELQNILDIEIQETKSLFKNEFGDEGIDLAELQRSHPRQNNDVVLHKSYRNPREILLVSTSVGFGLYNNKILQILENKDHWDDLGYNVIEGNCIKGEHTVIERPIENSPSIISQKQNFEEIIKYYVGKGMDDEINWVCNSIEEDIKQNLLPEDIMVICLDDRYSRQYFEALKFELAEKNIYTHNTLMSYKGDDFLVKGKVTLTTVYRAKGNESAMVYVVGTDSIRNKKDNVLTRNKVFTAFTRSKGWLRVSGANDGFDYLIEEIQRAKEYFPKIEFEYPDYEETKTLRRELERINEERNKKRRGLQEKLEQLGLDADEAMELLKEGEDKK